MKSVLIFAFLALAFLVNPTEKVSAGVIDPTYYDFNFSIYEGHGNYITGTIIGLENDATSSPFDILINSDPFNPAVGAGDYSLADNGYIASRDVDGQFTVRNGVITGVGQGGFGIGTGLEWYKVLSSGPGSQYSQISYNFDTFDDKHGNGRHGKSKGFNGESYEVGRWDITHGNEDGFWGTFYYHGTICPVPEPSQYGWALFLAFAAAISWKRFARRIP